MSRSTRKATIEEIARGLLTRREQGQPTILFLGSQTGGLFDNEYFYEILKQFSLLNFDTLSNVDKFRQCHYVLNKHFTERERHNILVNALSTLGYREEDKLLARLVKAGFFEAIISTNIDTLLEDACSAGGMREPKDYQVFIPGIDAITDIERNKPRYSSIVKVFGDLNSQHYYLTNEAFDLQLKDGLQEFLKSKLGKEVLLIGYDPVWDHAIEHAFSPAGETIWYVNETELSLVESHLAQIIKGRGHQYSADNLGSYSEFIKGLCSQDEIYKMIRQTKDLLGFSDIEQNMNNNFTPSTTLGTNKNKLTGANKKVSTRIEKEKRSKNIYTPINLEMGNRKQIFISYSHKDKRFLNELLPFLIPYEHTGEINCWSDKEIEVGTDWQEKILQALEAAEIAILLISQPFLSSKFITGIELPRLLSAARNKGLVIIPVILSNCVFHDTPLHQFQTINSLEKPMNRMKPFEREDIWVEIAKRVRGL